MLNPARHITIIGEAGTVAAGVEKAHRLRPDVLVIELRLPDERGADAFRRIHEASPDTRLLVLTYSADEWSIISALRSGVAGFLLKTVAGPELVRAVETVGAGQSILDPYVLSSVIAHIRNQPASICEKTYEKTRRTLSPQEHLIMELVVQGKTNKEIADTLGLNDKTVKNYLSNAYDKLLVTCRAHAASVFLRQT